MALALPRTNRNRHAVLILVPLLVVCLLWGWVPKLTGMPSASQMQSSFLIEFLLVGLALLWLNADKIGRCRGFVRLAGNLGLLLLAALVTALSYGSTFPEAQGITLPIASTIAGLILLVALALTRWLSRRRYRPLRFLLWLAVWCTLCTLVSAALFVSILMLVSSLPIRNLQDVNRQILTPGLLMALCLYAVNLPYLLLMFTSPFFHRRFHTWLGIESASVPSAEPRDVSGS